MSGVDDLVAFISARLDEREVRARRSAEEWDGLEVPMEGHDPGECETCDRARHQTLNMLDHPEFDDPAAVLADVEAKRRILTEAVPQINDLSDALDAEFTSVPRTGPCDEAFLLLRLLALPFAAHPDYDAERWAP